MTEPPPFLTARHDRLRQLYADRALIPIPAGRAHRLGCAGDVCTCVRERGLHFAELTRLMRCVTMELSDET